MIKFTSDENKITIEINKKNISDSFKKLGNTLAAFSLAIIPLIRAVIWIAVILLVLIPHIGHYLSDLSWQNYHPNINNLIDN